MFTAVQMKFDPQHASPPAWEGTFSMEDNFVNTDYEAYLLSAVMHYPVTVTMEVNDLRFTDLVEFFDRLGDGLPDAPEAKAQRLAVFLLGLKHV